MSRQIKTTLYSNLQFAQMFMNSMPAGLCTCVISDKVRMTYYNENAYELLGYTEDEFRRIAEDCLSVIYPPDVDRLKKTIIKAMTGEKKFEYAFRVRHKDGTYRKLHVNGVKEEGSAPLAVNLAYVDTTMDENMEAMTEELTPEIMYRARYDALTGIYNKETFLLEAEKLLQKNNMTDYVMACFVVERFKELSSFLGKEEGNRILKKVALRLEKKSNRDSLCGRLEGEEFVFLMPKSRIDFTNLVTSRVLMDENKNLDYQVDFSYGIYVIEDNTESPKEMMEKAELALSTLGSNSGKKYAFFDTALYNARLRTKAMVGSLQNAIKNEQMEIYFQPIYQLEGRELVGAEALIRWYHPQQGLISPYNYISVCEQNGCIAEIDNFVLTEVCKMIADRQEKGLKVIPIHINFSRINFYMPDICERIFSLTRKYGISPSLIKFEITEDGYTENPEQIVKAVDRLRRMGFEIIMDDFGKGYSSISMLMEVSVSTLKVDMKLLNATPNIKKDQNIVMNVIKMAKDMKMNVIAERVETEEQVSYLREIGCDNVQGFLFSRPLPEKELIFLLNEA